MREWIHDEVEKVYSEVVKLRRMFHQYPECSFNEKETSKKVAEYLQQMGIDVKTHVGDGYGVIGLLKGNANGPTIALRADMDALPIQDEKECDYRSKVPGVMHACGHDGHTSQLLGVAKVLSKNKDKLFGNVLFIFQPAEEVPPGGAKGMVETGILDGVEAVYGIHLWSTLPTGVVGIRDGITSAAADLFEVKITGKGGHAAKPHETKDSIVIAAYAIVQLQSIISRRVNPLDSAVITVGKINGGQAFNVISEGCYFAGTVRTFNDEIRQQMKRDIEKVLTSVCELFDAEYKLDYQLGYPPMVNDYEAVRRIKKIANEVVGSTQVREVRPTMGGEDFAYYLHHKPGAFIFVGAGNPDLGIQAPHHHPKFDIDEKSMKVSMKLFLGIVMDYLDRR